MAVKWSCREENGSNSVGSREERMVVLGVMKKNEYAMVNGKTRRMGWMVINFKVRKVMFNAEKRNLY